VELPITVQGFGELTALGGAVPSWLAALALGVSQQRLNVLSDRYGWRVYFPNGYYLIRTTAIAEWCARRDARRKALQARPCGLSKAFNNAGRG